jgi:hypothetical protein
MINAIKAPTAPASEDVSQPKYMPPKTPPMRMTTGIIFKINSLSGNN